MRRHLRSAALATALITTALTAQVHATTIEAATDGRWYQFDIDESLSGNLRWVDAVIDNAEGDNEGLYQGDYSDLSFSFTLANAGLLTIVDAAIAGDEFQVMINGQAYNTSSVDSISAAYEFDFEAALADSGNFSALTIQLAPGTYTITGALFQSALDENETPYNTTVGGLRVAEVPLPASIWLFGTALAGVIARTRRRA